VTGRLLAAAATVLVAALPVAACDRTEPAPVDRLVIATGADDSVYDRLGRALVSVARDRWGVDARVRATAGSVENLRLVAAGEVDVAFTTVDVAAAAVHGDHPFDSAASIVALAGLYDDYLHVVVRADSDITQISDLSGLTMSAGPAESGTDIVAARILEAAGHGIHNIERSYLDAADSAEALRAGEIDGFFVTGGLPTSAVADLARHLPIRVLSAREEVREIQQRQPDLYLARSIPPSTYGLDGEVETLGIRNVLVVRWDMPERVAHWITELLFAAKSDMARAHEEARRLDSRAAVATHPLPLHPGAARYYLESKAMALAAPTSVRGDVGLSAPPSRPTPADLMWNGQRGRRGLVARKYRTVPRGFRPVAESDSDGSQIGRRAHETDISPVPPIISAS
jgi:hypothetical protein